MNAVTRDNLVFYSALTAVILFFCWSRFDNSDRIYYFGDGNTIVSMIGLLVEGRSWDDAIIQLIETQTYQEELKPFTNLPSADHHYYNFSGYVMLAATVCKGLYAIGLDSLSIPRILHGLNVTFQGLTLILLYLVANRAGGRFTGLWAMAFFTAFPLALIESHYERQESWLCLLGTALVYVALRFHEAPRIISLLMGILIGLSITAKYSHVYLGIVPAILLASQLLHSPASSRMHAARDFITNGLIVVTGIVLAMAINVPSLMMHLPDYFAEIRGITQIYQKVNYPYAMEQYSYLGQMGVIANYFMHTLGGLWIAAFVIGTIVLLVPRWRPEAITLPVALVITTPVLFLVVYFSAQLIFIERNFATVEGLISIISAIGLVKITQQRQVLAAAVLALILIVPIRLDIAVVSHYFTKQDNPPRQAFELPLKQDFEGFWIKNVYFTHNYTGALPEKAPKAPRLYKVEDLNEHWSRDYVAKLQASGFTRVAVYCSEFAQLPPNNLTIYHSAAKYHYFVRNDEWPADVAKDYFRSNCQ